MTAPLEARGATLRWFKRGIERRFEDEIEAWTDNEDNEAGTAMRFGAEYGQHTDGETGFVRVRICLYVDDEQFSVELDGGVEFLFGSPQLDRSQATDFVREQGIGYLLGIQRGVLADMTREVGLPAAMLPTGTPVGLVEDIDNVLTEIEQTVAE